MRYCFLLIFFLTNFAFGQNLDSLWSVWSDESKSDIERMSAMYTFTWNGFMFTKPDSAYKLAEIHLNYAKERGNKSHVGYALYHQGVALAMQGRYSDSRIKLEESYDVRAANNDTAGVASSLAGLANINLLMADFEGALNTYERSVRIFEGRRDNQGQSACYINMANCHLQLGRLETSLTYVDSAYYIDIETNDSSGLANVYSTYGKVYKDMHDFRKTLDYFNKSQSISIALGEKIGVANSANDIGLVLIKMGRHHEALEKFKYALELHREHGSPQDRLIVLLNTGMVYHILEHFQESMDYYSESLEIALEIEDRYNVAQLYVNLGSVYKGQGDSLYRLGKNVEAKEYYQKGLESNLKGLKISTENGQKQIIANAYNGVSIAYAMLGEYDKAINAGDSCFRISEEVGYHQEELYGVRCLHELYSKVDSVKLAKEFAERMIAIREKEVKVNFPVLSEGEKADYFAQMTTEFDFFYDHSLEYGANSPELLTKSFDNALMSKGLLLKSSTAMRNAIYNSGDSDLIDLYQRWIVIKRRIAKDYALGNPTVDLEKEANGLEKELVTNSNEFSEIQNVQNLNWKSVQKDLKENEVAIELIRFKHRKSKVAHTVLRDPNTEIIYAALLIKGDSKHPEMIRLFAEEDLEKILGTFPGNNLSYIEQVYGTGQNTKTQLYDLIWKPMEKSLEGVEKVYVSPVGLLHKISFAALAKEQDVYLCDLYDIETMSSTGKIALTSDNGQQTSDLSYTVFGGVDYNSDSTQTELWSYLEGSLTEAQMIQKTLKKKEVNYYVANEASEDNFKEIAPSSTILHIATHGFFYPDPESVEEEIVDNDESSEDLAFRGGKNGFGVESFVKNKNPLMRSGLALAGANDVWSRVKSDGEDGVLTAAEVATIDMRNTELVVLSACETGLGDIKGSEGVYGLQRSFKMAGVNYLIMSLWQVPDKETAEFMTTFYKNLTKTNDIKKSFNLTQQSMRKKYDPYYWAAFVLVE